MKGSSSETQITCPHCGKSIELTQALVSQLEEKYEQDTIVKIKTARDEALKEAEAKANEKYTKDVKSLRDENSALKTEKQQLLDNQLKLEIEKRKLADDKQKFELDKQTILNKERDKLRAEGKAEAKLKTQELEKTILAKEEENELLRKNELELRQQKRVLEQKEKTITLEIERKVDERMQGIYKEAQQEASSEYIIKLKEKDLQLESMKKTIEELKKKSEQGSQQQQGEAQEIVLEDFLRINFPYDDIKPIGKGQKGADVLQIVKNSFGQECGSIYWESKRTKDWKDSWITKLKEDQREMKAVVGVIISQVLPDDINLFGLKDDVWVGAFKVTIGIATSLREQLLQIALVKNSEVGKNQKMESLYSYLTSHEFAHRIRAIIEAFEAMKSQIGAEKKAFEKQWASREKMLEQVIKNTSGLHGDLQGIIGAALPTIEALELPEISVITTAETAGVEELDSDDLPF